MGVNFRHNIHDLAADCGRIPIGASFRADSAVSETADQGRDLAKDFARVSAGKHGKHYHKAITSERLALARYEYGPDSALPQGGMSFEYGSRNQPPHLDIARSADGIGPVLSRKVGDAVDKAFWNG